MDVRNALEVIGGFYFSDTEYEQFEAMIWSPADSGYLKEAGKWLEVTKKFNEEETTDYTAKQFKELCHSLTTTIRKFVWCWSGGMRNCGQVGTLRVDGILDGQATPGRALQQFEPKHHGGGWQ
uniref:Uncharacterized protein n=1 Tax=Ditylenchus dipsaci TaxID=166011 RepID=A0A915CV84_9BILA